ncbi:TonB-dependent receptor [Nitratireductor sp. ZSWI3]|uniref:TonB-dependent receptor n=1 Tax=Nitratireductor sp. ZSWI3 TaxID=2966359 RepID=UPI0021505F1A|nr:TonB-dependent receptor [Nitratireductor sp. ZSWI3]MCR4264862.1 TonB-dependent receptor [Nitratireductor sp. ZSWI3]
MRNRAWSFLLPICLIPTAAWSQEQASGSGETTLLDRLLVTAGRDERSIASVAQSVQVLEEEDVREAMKLSPDANDLISRLVPGYSPSNQTISGASETFRGRSVLIMVDGVPRNTPLRDVSRILSLIDLNTVERIEVVNGASSLYGAGATGGTINFITKRGTSDKPTVTMRTGLSVSTTNPGRSAAPEASLSVEGRQNNFDYFLSATGDLTRRTYDGHGNEMASDAMLGQGGGDRTGSADLFGSVGYETGSQRFEMSFDWTYARQKPDWFTDYTADPVRPDFSSAYTGEPLEEDSKYLTGKYTDSDFVLGNLEIKAFYNDISKRSPFTTLSSVNSMVYYSGDPLNPTAWFNQSALETRRTGVNLTINTPIDLVREGATLTWGADYGYDETRQKLTNGDDAIAPMSQHTLSAFAQLEMPVTDRFRVQGGVRFDQFFLTVDDFLRPAAVVYPATSLAHLYPAVNVAGGSFDYNAFSFNAGAVFDVTSELQLFGNFSQGYSLTDIGAFTRRAGVNSLAEICDAYGALAAIYGCSGVPDFAISYSDIAPEPQLVNTYEAGLRGDWGVFRGTISAYLSTSDDGVNYDVVANRVSQQKERIWGVEATAAYEVNDIFTVGGLLAYQEGRYDANRDGSIGNGEYLPNNRIPSTWKGLAYVSASFGNGLKARGEIEYFSGRDRVEGENLDGGTLVNLALSKEFADGGELSIAVRNVFDEFYINPTATATRGAPVPGLGRTIFAAYTKTF